MNLRWKVLTFNLGTAAIFIGILMLPLSFCILASALGYYYDDELPFRLVFVALLISVTLGGGWFLRQHAGRSLAGQRSLPLRLPFGLLLWGIPLALFAGEFLRRAEDGWLLFPVPVLLSAALPPLAALAWTILPPQGQDEVAPRPGAAFTYRQAIIAFILGATLSVFLTLLISLFVPGFVLLAAEIVWEFVSNAWDTLLRLLEVGQAEKALLTPGFLLILVEMAVVAPLVEELAKPLPMLPLLRAERQPRRAFLIGAAAGAGFAALENVLYMLAAGPAWSGILLLRALGSGIHPLGSGLTALGWNRAAHAPKGQRVGIWLRAYATAVTIHALWNGGSLLFLVFVTSLGNQLEDYLPRVSLLDASIPGLLLAFLAVLGAGAWLGLRRLSAGGSLTWQDVAELPGEIQAGRPSLPSWLPAPGVTNERDMALWGILCLVLLLPIGWAALRLLGGQ